MEKGRCDALAITSATLLDFPPQHLMKRIQRGPVRGISLKLQEEERERRMDFIPKKSILDVDTVDVDVATRDLLKSLDFGDMQGTHDCFC